MATAAQPEPAIEVFYSYSHRDRELRDELERHLSILKRSGFIRVWHDREIDAGTEWAGQIHEHLNRADVILLLISADFLASDYCYDVEMRRAIERHDAGEAIVIPIILRSVDWSDAPFARLQCLPADARPVTSWGNRDEAFRNVAEGIRRAIGKAARRLEAQVEERALDAAIPTSVLVGKSVEMLAMIRRIGSQGLKAVLQVETSHDAAERDVQSKPFRMEFPRNASGGLEAQVLTVRLESNDFDCPQPSKQIPVPPDRDSEAYPFLVTPRRAGQLAMIVEVLHQGISVASRLLRTNGEDAPQFVSAGTYRLASLPLTIYARGLERLPPPLSAGPPVAVPAEEFTRMFQAPKDEPAASAVGARLPSEASEPGEFSQFFGRPGADAPSSSEAPPPPPSPARAGSTGVFSPAPEMPAAPSQPDGYTRVGSPSPERVPAPESEPRMPAPSAPRSFPRWALLLGVLLAALILVLYLAMRR